MNTEELRRVVVDQLHATRQSIGLDGGEVADGGLDLTSLDLVRLLVSLEEQLDIEIDEVAIMNARLDTVDDVVTLVQKSFLVSPTGGGE
jgi:acyl carrier protein